jgi:hypothetical protein
MNLILVLIHLQISVSAASGSVPSIVVEPLQIGKNQGSFLASKNYEDVRVFERKTQKLKYWMINSKNLKVEQFFTNGKLKEFRASEVSEKIVKEIRYLDVQGKMRLIYAVLRGHRHMLGLLKEQKSANICRMRVSLTDEVAKLSKNLNLNVCKANIEGQLIDSKCKEIFSTEEYNILKNAYATNLYLPEEDNTILSCLDEEKNQKILAEACGITEPTEIQSEVDVIKLMYKLNASKVYNAPDLVKNKVKCELTSTGQTRAETDEAGNTTFYKSTVKAFEPMTSVKMDRLVAHELVHGSGVNGEVTTGNIIDICYNNVTKVNCHFNTKIVKSVRTKGVTAQMMAPPSLKDVEQLQGDEASKSNAKISNVDISNSLPKTLPENTGPSAEVITKSTIDSSKEYRESQFSGGDSTQYSQIAYQKSMAMSEKPLSTARTLMNLATSSIPLATAGAIGQRTVEARGPASLALSAATSNFPQTSENGNDKLKEIERRLASNDSISTGSVATNGSDVDAKAAKVSRRPANDLGSNPDNPGSVKSSRSANGIDSSYSSSATIRNPASSKALGEQQKIAQLIEQSAYEDMQNRLNRNDFIRKLKENNITIVKLNGAPPLGAAKGEIVYLDKGSERKFVRQK